MRSSSGQRKSIIHVDTQSDEMVTEGRPIRAPYAQGCRGTWADGEKKVCLRVSRKAAESGVQRCGGRLFAFDLRWSPLRSA